MPVCADFLLGHGSRDEQGVVTTQKRLVQDTLVVLATVVAVGRVLVLDGRDVEQVLVETKSASWSSRGLGEKKKNWKEKKCE